MIELRFECQPGCTACCEQKGWVYITERDIVRQAEFLGLSPAAYEARYVYRTKNQLRLRKPPGKACHFLESGRCAIHPVKPVQCRLFPFWPELVEDRASWDGAAVYCPGIGKGGLVQIGAAMELASEMKTAYPYQY